MDWVEQIDRFGGEFLAESRGTEEEERDIFFLVFSSVFLPVVALPIEIRGEGVGWGFCNAVAR
jgi:hypothetical protein